MIQRVATSVRGRTHRKRDLGWLVAGGLALLLGELCYLLLGPAAMLLFAGGAAASWLLVPLIARFAARRGAVVLPGGRAIHRVKTPSLGGLAIYLPLMVYLAATGGEKATGLALGCSLLVIAGVVDDLRGLSPKLKILAQVGGALALLASGYGIPVIAVGSVSIATGPFGALVAVFWVVLACNAINLIDGMDGLAATVSLVAVAAAVALGLGDGAALLLAGALVGFLRHNLPPARIFLGDTGSLLVGFLLAAFFMEGPGPMHVPVAVGLLAVPLGDVALSTMRRWIRGKPIFAADRGHVHHMLLNTWNGSQNRVLLGLGGLAALQALCVGLSPAIPGLAGVLGLWMGAIAFLLWRGKPRWRHMLLHRRDFRRFHLVRRYACQALSLAENPCEVRSILGRVAEDFGLRAIRLGGIRIERGGDLPGSPTVEEQIDCGDMVGIWSSRLGGGDPILAEEKRTILCDLLRRTHDRIVHLGLTGPDAAGAAPAAVPTPAPAARDRARVHFVADSPECLQRVAALVRETRRRGILEPVIVHTGRRDDLGLSDARMRELGIEPPAIDLDVPPCDGIVLMARVMERYHALLDAARPAVVVVRDTTAGTACALAAKEYGTAVAQLGDPAAVPGERLGALRRAFDEPMADLVFSARLRRREPGTDSRQMLLGESFAAEQATRIVPALEALLESPGA